MLVVQALLQGLFQSFQFAAAANVMRLDDAGSPEGRSRFAATRSAQTKRLVLGPSNGAPTAPERLVVALLAASCLTSSCLNGGPT